MNIFQKLLLKIMDPFADAFTKILLNNKYETNPFSMLSIIEKLTPRIVMEAGIRATTGKALARSLGSAVSLSPWEKLLLSPRQIHRFPTNSVSEVRTTIVIGPNCRKPLHLEMPILITAMSLGGSLSRPMKEAIAKGTAIAGTSTNTGESNITNLERDNAKFLIAQFNRAMRMDEEKLYLADAIEIQFGQGAWGGSSEIIDKAEMFDDFIRQSWNISKGEDSTVRPIYPEIKSPEDIVEMINNFKSRFDVPIGVKIAGSNFIEKDLEILTQANFDFFTIDGCEGGTIGAPPTLEDDVGLPTLFSLARAVKWLEDRNLKDKFQILITGGLRTPGEILKALALGADAVYIGSIALIATLNDQITKSLPEKPPTQLVSYTGEIANEFDIEKGAVALSNFLISCNEEIKAAVQVLGKKSVTELNKDDLVSVDRNLAVDLDISYAAGNK